MKAVSTAHQSIVHSRRIRQLAAAASALIPDIASNLLDVGSGDGKLGALLQRDRPKLKVTGTDVLVRANTAIPTVKFDGRVLPLNDASVDVVTLIDVVHHSDDQLQLLRECRRVARLGVLIKDHLCESKLDLRVLALMDFVGNAAHGVNLPYAYWSRQDWQQNLTSVRLRPLHWSQRLKIYPWFTRPLFERDLHFMAFCVPMDHG